MEKKRPLTNQGLMSGRGDTRGTGGELQFEKRGIELVVYPVLFTPPHSALVAVLPTPSWLVHFSREPRPHSLFYYYLHRRVRCLSAPSPTAWGRGPCGDPSASRRRRAPARGSHRRVAPPPPRGGASSVGQRRRRETPPRQHPWGAPHLRPRASARPGQ